MIPTMILFGLVLGRWWRIAVITAAIVWPAILLSGGVLEGTPAEQLGVLAGGSLLGAANAALGAAVHQAVWLAVVGTSVAARGAWRRGNRRAAQP